MDDEIEDISLKEGVGLTKNARKNFVKQVYSILSVQLLITVMFVTLNILSPTFA